MSHPALEGASRNPNHDEGLKTLANRIVTTRLQVVRCSSDMFHFKFSRAAYLARLHLQIHHQGRASALTSGRGQTPRLGSDLRAAAGKEMSSQSTSVMMDQPEWELQEEVEWRKASRCRPPGLSEKRHVLEHGRP
eukprot:271530-Hanusia_phi.AAC.2